MDIEEYKKLARNKIEADDLTKQVRDVIKITHVHNLHVKVQDFDPFIIRT